MTDAIKKEGAYWQELARHPTGSRFICDPPVLDTDDDWVILVEDLEYAKYKAARLDWYHAGGGYYREGSDHEELGPFVSMRQPEGNSNYIFTEDAEFYDRYVAATLLAKKYNLLNKPDRIQLFHAVLYGEYIDPPVPKEAVTVPAVGVEPAVSWRGPLRSDHPLVDYVSESATRREEHRQRLVQQGRSITGGSITGVVLDDMMNLVTEEERAIGRVPEIRHPVPEFDWIADLSDPVDSGDTLPAARQDLRGVRLRD